jgi:hypothetical protein
MRTSLSIDRVRTSFDERHQYAVCLAVSYVIASSGMDSHTYTAPCPTSPTKRPRDGSADDKIKHESQARYLLTTQRIEDASSEDHSVDEERNRSITPITPTEKDRQYQRVDSSSTSREKQSSLTKRQHRLLRQWYEDFAQPDVAPSLSDEHMVAFATAIQARSELVIDYVRRRRRSIATAGYAVQNEQQARRSPGSVRASTESYTLAGANSHLPPPTMTLVNKYISVCRRRRSPNDGRRSVNSGPYRCTFDCGYRTKRAFDWRRHEETHEPQELWLCCICSQTDMNNPFLVNRKDKFLKHASDKHTASGPETVLDKSKLEFVPRAELGCRYCGEECGNWDERCRHVLGHFENEVERDVKRVKVVKKNRGADEVMSTGDSGSRLDSQEDQS